jgi:hypothetical protein
MFGSRRWLALVGVVAAVLLGVLVHRGPVSLDGDVGGARDRASTSAAAVVDAGPVGVVPSAVRDRTWPDTELSSLVQSSKTRLGALVLALVSGLLPVAAVSWCLARRGRRPASPLGRFSLAALRAPPAPVSA